MVPTRHQSSGTAGSAEITEDDAVENLVGHELAGQRVADIGPCFLLLEEAPGKLRPLGGQSDSDDIRDHSPRIPTLQADSAQRRMCVHSVEPIEVTWKS